VQGDFAFAVSMANEVEKSRTRPSRSSANAAGVRAGMDKSYGLNADPKYPIIIVPEPTRTARLCMWNAKSFLQDGVYVKVEAAKAAAKAAANGKRLKEKQQDFVERGGVKFRILPVSITQKPKFWSQNDFKRVVAVFADGTTFRYKGWPQKSPEAIFHEIQGFHVHYVDEGPEEKCKKWFVDKVPVRKDDAQRFLDKSAVVKVWERLDLFIKLKKPAYIAKNWVDPEGKDTDNGAK
jgi:parafibromin